ncbi:hypothetical protein M0805_000922 [Coniferiporia weirii]|nr:hypothetical protein M0805_000922 [Coniferiporia weirii]
MAAANERERLDVEDDEQREARLRHLLDRANNTASSSPFTPSGPSQFDFGVRETRPVEPPTKLLERLHDFLPQMEAANAELERRVQTDPESVDIEHLGHAGDGQYIEMNLGLGVFDVRRPASELDDPSSDDSGSSDDDASISDTSTGNGTDASSSAIGGHASSPIGASPTQRPTRPLPKRTRPGIVVLDDSETAGRS